MRAVMNIMARRCKYAYKIHSAKFLSLRNVHCDFWFCGYLASLATYLPNSRRNPIFTSTEKSIWQEVATIPVYMLFYAASSIIPQLQSVLVCNSGRIDHLVRSKMTTGKSCNGQKWYWVKMAKSKNATGKKGTGLNSSCKNGNNKRGFMWV